MKNNTINNVEINQVKFYIRKKHKEDKSCFI